jgi:hypothetical protein
MGDGDRKIDRGNTYDLALRIGREADGAIKTARDELVALQISEGAWTTFTYDLAVAYNEVEAFVVKELDNKLDRLIVMANGVGLNTRGWQGAEDATISDLPA